MSFNNLDLINPDFIYPITAGTKFYVEEAKDLGKGKCYFESNNNILFLKSKDQCPVVWSLKNKKCAEAAFVVKHIDNTSTLHIIEMKSKLSLSGFLKVIDQWKGMFLSSLAALGVIKENFPDQVIVYVAFKENAIDNINPSQPVLHKTLTGGGLMPGQYEWKHKYVLLDHGVKAKIVIGVRAPDDFDFGIV